MVTKLGHWAVVLLLGLPLLLGGAATPVGAQTPPEIQLLATAKGCGAGATFVPGEGTHHAFRVSHRSRAVLTLRRPSGVTQTLVDQTVEGGITYLVGAIIGSDIGEWRLTLTATVEGLTDTETCTYSVSSGSGDGPPEIQLLNTNKGCGDAATFVPGELIRIFFRISHRSRVVLSVQRQGGPTQTVVDQTLAGGITFFADGIIGGFAGRRTITLTATAGDVTDTETCTYTVPGSVPVQDLAIQLLTTNKGCGASFRVGEFVRTLVRVSHTSVVTLTETREGGQPEPIFQNVVLLGGVTYFLDSMMGPRTGPWTLRARAAVDSMADEETCAFTVVP